MGETANNSTHDPALEQPPLEQLPSAELPGGDFVDDELHEVPDTTGGDFVDDELPEKQDTAEGIRAAYTGWLERRGIDPATTPHLTMRWRELLMFSNAPPNYVDGVKELYGIPKDDQDDCQYVFLDIESDDPSQPNTPWLLTVNEADFGTLIDSDRVAGDFEESDQDPDSPLTPKPEGTVRIIDIQEAIADSADDLRTLTSGLMKGRTVDPFAEGNGDIGIRAGEVAPWQTDAYVWTVSPITKSVELTIALPDTYQSVCIISGEKRDAGNGKAAMAQIDNPTVLLKIEGEDLTNLQNAYRRLYKEPDFAVSRSQRDTRDELFNDYVKGLISEQARKNRAQQQAREDDERRFRQQPLKARQLPRP
jgi:hypothetical protein